MTAFIRPSIHNVQKHGELIMKKGRIAEMLGIEYPIFQGGMAWIADADLAAAVSNAGGLGIIAAGNADTEYVRGQVRKAKEMTSKPFGLNIMLLT